ncbi:MAG: hypothetical protein AAB681_03045 [Patescibacteria group bacterium]
MTDKKQYTVVIWEKDKEGECSCSTECHTESLEFAIAFAGFIYCKKLVELDALAEGDLNVWNRKPIEALISKIKDVYITVLDDSDRKVTEPDKIIVVKEYGDASVGTFPRYALH